MNPASCDPRQLRVGLLFLGAALLLNFHFFTVGWGNTLLGYHQFRQVQTAIASDYYLRDGISLHYITPLLGPPWEVPLEFPLFQISAAECARWTGLELDPAGRLASWLYFIAALPAGFLLLRRFNLAAGHRLLFPALLLLSPIYLFYSRAFLIESTAFSMACWFLLCFERSLTRTNPAWLGGAIAFGALAGMTKGTTLVVFLVAALLILAAELRSPGSRRLNLWIRAGIAAAVPLAASFWWMSRAAAIRHHNPDAVFLDSVFGAWSFGDLGLRFSWGFWAKTFRVWADAIVGEGGLLLIAVSLLLVRGPHRRAAGYCIAAFFSGQLIFANLYWIHDYYFYASAVFLVAALGFSLVDLLQHPALSKWSPAVLVSLVLVLELSAYDRSFLDAQRKNTPVPHYVELVKAISDPSEIILVFGQDWDGALPYYSGRKALMFLTGRETDPTSMQRSLSRLDRSKIAAVIMSGLLWRDNGLMDRAMSSLKLGDRPLLYNDDGIGIWVPIERHAALRESFAAREFPDFNLAPIPFPPTEGITLNALQIRRRREFDGFLPRPIQAHASYDFTATPVNHKKMLLANASSELVFAIPANAQRITATYGLTDESFINGHTTDGIEMKVSLRATGGVEKVLYSRYLNPLANDSDRGPQKLDLALPTAASGELIVRMLPGPANDMSFDWSYIGFCTIR